jgi:excisionase family DNA binding protein
MKFTPDELAEIRSAFRQRIKTEPTRKRPARRKRKSLPLPALVREPDYVDAEILSPAQAAELFAVTPRTVRRWADAGTLPVFRTVGGHRRFRFAVGEASRHRRERDPV